MAIITKPDQLQKNESASVQLNKNELASLSLVSLNQHFSDQLNWKKVTLFYTSQEDNQLVRVVFKAVEEFPVGIFKTSARVKDILEIQRILIEDFDAGYLNIPRSQLITSDFDISFLAPVDPDPVDPDPVDPDPVDPDPVDPDPVIIFSIEPIPGIFLPFSQVARSSIEFPTTIGTEINVNPMTISTVQIPLSLISGPSAVNINDMKVEISDFVLGNFELERRILASSENVINFSVSSVSPQYVSFNLISPLSIPSQRIYIKLISDVFNTVSGVQVPANNSEGDKPALRLLGTLL